MLFFGHIAASLLIADATGADPGAAVAGNLVPDVTDKTLNWVLRLTPSSRWLAHGLPFFALMSLAALALLEPRRARGFIVGYAGHLLCDLWAGGRVPWLAPFVRQRRPLRKHAPTVPQLALYLLPELIGAPFVCQRLMSGRARTQPRGGAAARIETADSEMATRSA